MCSGTQFTREHGTGAYSSTAAHEYPAYEYRCTHRGGSEWLQVHTQGAVGGSTRVQEHTRAAGSAPPVDGRARARVGAAGN